MLGRPPKVDRIALHVYLWEKSDRVGRIRFNQTTAADELGVHRVTLARCMRELIDAGAIVKMAEGQKRIVLYKVNPPSDS